MRNIGQINSRLESGNQRMNIEEYWLKRFSGKLVKSFFPYDKNGNGDDEEKKGTFTDQIVNFKINLDLSAKLIKLSKNSDVRLQMILMTGLFVLLNKYTGSEDITIGAPVYNQESDQDLLNTVLAIRSQFTNQFSYKDLLLQVQKSLVEAIENQNYPIELLTHQLKMKNSMETLSLFEVGFLLENIQDKEHFHPINCNMIFSFHRIDESLEGKLEYNSNLYSIEKVELIISHLKQIFHDTLLDINKPFSLIEGSSTEEKNQLLFEFNRTKADFPKYSTIPELFENEVLRNKDFIAMVFVESFLTIGELNTSANQLAELLCSEGVVKDSVVGLMMDRSLEMVIGMMGVLKSGGAFLPIDPHFPEERIMYMLDDSDCRLLISNNVNSQKYQKICHTIDPNQVMKLSKYNENPSIINYPSDLAYVIYTSGSTGKSKGVLIQHRSVINFFMGIESYLGFRKDSNEIDQVILALTTISFDIFILETIFPLLSGIRLVIADKAQQNDPNLMQEVIKCQSVNLLQLTPSRLKLILISVNAMEFFEGISHLLIGGETFPDQLLKTIQEEYKGEIINLYGPTESTIWSTIQNLSHMHSVNIGSPIINTQIYILNSLGGIQLMGVPGELCIGGLGLARGYLNRPELTLDKFQKFNHPLLNRMTQQDGIKIYRTGDLARWRKDGCIEFLGRLDHQVKVRGFRIELGEIENILLSHENITESAVIAREDERNDKFLCAYFVSNLEIQSTSIREFLSLYLPDYMVPSYFCQLDKIPLTANGKIDRLSLPIPDIDDMKVGQPYVPPRNEKEKMVAEIWAQILEVEKVGIKDDFFELGGHSLKAVSIISLINNKLNSNLPMSIIFDRKTIESLMEELTQTREEAVVKIEKCKTNDYYELSHSQKRLWFFSQMEPENPAYNIPMSVQIKGNVNGDIFQLALNKLLQRHESLRTSIKLMERTTQKDLQNGNIEADEDYPVQIINSDVQLKFQFRDFSKLDKANRDTTFSQLMKEDGVNVFDLSQAPLFRTTLVKLDNELYAVIFVMHHIISDAWSIGVLIKEFFFFYNQIKNKLNENLPALTFQYKDYAYWQHRMLEEGGFQKQQDYWHQKLKGTLPNLEFPTDYPRSSANSYLGDKISFKLDEHLTRKLKKLVKRETSTLFMILVAAFKTLLYRYTNDEDIIIGTLTAGRSSHEWRLVQGYFVNIFALRDSIKGQLSFKNFLNYVRSTILEAFDNQDYPFDKLVDELKVRRDTSRSPIFDIMMVFQNEENMQLDISDDSMEIRVLEKEYVVNKYDMYLDFIELPNQININYEFRNDLFKKDTIQRLINHYLNILHRICDDPEKLISKIEMISSEEKQKLLYEFNNTQIDIPRNQCFPGLFKNQVSNTPKGVAVEHNGETITFEELEERSNRVGYYLMEKGIQSNQMVALYMNRSIEMVVSIIGVFKSGAAYLPIEVDYPIERVCYLLENGDVNRVIADKDNLETLCDIISEGLLKQNSDSLALKGILCIDSEDPTPIKNDLSLYEIDSSKILEMFPSCQPEIKSSPNDYAYMIYTSGSTGQPKGVLIHQLGMINHLYAKISDLSIKETDRIAHTASPCFDISVWQFLSALLKGGTTVIFDYEVVLNPEALLRGLQETKITIFETVPSLLSVFLEMLENNANNQLNSLRWVIPTGEALKPALVRQWFKYYPSIPIVNAYGPTEASDDITHFVIQDPSVVEDGTVPIGKPIQNMKIYILDKNHSLCSVGIRGEICVAGIGVGKGYWKNVEKTEYSFIKNPFGIGGLIEDYGTLYKTGDVGYYRDDGTIVCLGRLDNQVKIRGFRIELEEIEKVLMNHAGVAECCVVVNEKSDSFNELICFIKEKESINNEELKRFLLDYLPPYMIPSAFVKMEEFPLGISGKVDRSALSAIASDSEIIKQFSEPKREFTSPRNETEEKIARIWRKALNTDQIGVYDNFFDLGGHSLLIPRVFRNLDKQFPGKFEIADLFDLVSIDQLSQHIEGSNNHDQEKEVVLLDID